MKRGSRCGIDKTCEMESSDIFVRGDIVSIVLTSGIEVVMPEEWGLIHDPSGNSIDRCEVFVTPYAEVTRSRARKSNEVGSDAKAYFGSDTRTVDVSIDIPSGPWKRVGYISCINYDRHGNLEGPYYHDTDVPKRPSERAILFEQTKSEVLCGVRCRPFRISLPDGCRINAHGFIWP